jgi:hypothetical protein
MCLGAELTQDTQSIWISLWAPATQRPIYLTVMQTATQGDRGLEVEGPGVEKGLGKVGHHLDISTLWPCAAAHVAMPGMRKQV